MIAIGSVRHSGTRFCRKLLDTPPNYHFGGIKLERLDGFTVITPLRRLSALMVSWARRDMDLSDLHKALGIMVDFQPDYYLPIDSDRRDDYLALFNAGVGEDFKTDWGVVKDAQRSAPNWVIDSEWETRIHADFDSFFAEFYNG